jgi:membrane-bound lytic murein transglycosylase D
MGRNVYYSDAKKGIFIFNRIKTIKAKGRTPLEIAMLYGLNFEKLKKYNDLVGDEKFKEGQNVFLQPKRFKGSQKDYLVKPGDSMWDISQMFGIKMSSLLKKNLLAPGQQAKPGETLMLRKKRKTEIQTIAYKEVLKTKRLIEAEKPKRVVNKTFIKPLGTTIDIIQESKDVEVDKPKVFKPAQIEELEEIEPVNPVEVVNKYPKEKYVEKNEELEKLINEIPVVKSSQTNESKPNINVKSGLTHKVKQGETLYFISRKYNVSLDELKILNNLQDNGINIGQYLIILQK